MSQPLVNIIARDQYAIVQMNREKGNALNLELLKELRTAFADIEASDQFRGMILTGQPGYFSVGVDIVTMLQRDDQYYLDLWTEFSLMAIGLVKFRKPAIAAVTGHSPAGGCVMAVACDYRYMVDGPKFRIGLNETRVGIPIPKYIFELYSFLIGKRKAYQYLLEGKMLNCEEAFHVGLIDELTTQDELLHLAEAKMQHLLEVPDNVLQASKFNMRQEVIKVIDVDPTPGMQKRLKEWQDPANKQQMMELVMKLRAKK
ncbi:MAG: enoyl-CoA hydratase/isomerase family protein [Bacteroidota bacterium]